MRAKIKVSENRIWLPREQRIKIAINGVSMVFENYNKFTVRIRIPEPKRSK